MATTAFIIWDLKPEIFPSLFENLFIHPRWYGVLFALGFLIGYQIMKRIFLKEKEKSELVDSLLMYVMIGTVVGARLGHVLFYDLSDYLQNPLSILKVWEGGLASHGAVIGNITAIWLWAKKYNKTRLWTLDRVVITIALAGALIRTGNFMNSEIYGNPTGTTSGIVFARSSTESFIGNQNIEEISTSKGAVETVNDSGWVEAVLHVTFNKNVKDETHAEDIIQNYIIYNLKVSPRIRENLLLAEDSIFPDYSLDREGQQITAQIPVMAVPRYPSQIYEATAYLIIFLILMFIFTKTALGKRQGFIFGAFLILIFGFRFAIEFLKANQSAFEEGMALNMGQILSIPCVLVGLFFIVRAKAPKTEQ